MNFSDRWADRERRLENDEPTNDTYSDKQKVNIVTGDKDDEEEQPFSGLYCIFCHDFAYFIYEGNSICHTCLHKEVGDLIRKNKK